MNPREDLLLFNQQSYNFERLIAFNREVFSYDILSCMADVFLSNFKDGCCIQKGCR